MKTIMLTALALLASAALPAHAADSWTPPQQLSGPKDTYAGSSAAIDARGDAVAVWVDQRSINGSGIPDRLLARTRMAGAALGPSSTVAVLDIVGDIYDPHVYITDWLAVAANNQAITTWTGAVGSAPAGFVSIHNPQ